MSQAGNSTTRRIRRVRDWLPCGLIALGLVGGGGASSAAEPRPLSRFERIVIDADMPGGYQVEVADVNGDRKPDVVALGGGTCAWYENPTWKKRIVTNSKQTPGIISSATADLDGDGKAEIAIAYEFAMNQPAKGKLLLAHQGKQIDDPWIVEPVADIGSIHRLRWNRTERTPTDIPGQSRVRLTPPTLEPTTGAGVRTSFTLVVAPIFGPTARPPLFDQEPAHLVSFEAHVPRKPQAGRPGGGFARGEGVIAMAPTPGEMTTAPVLHAIDVADLYGIGNYSILGASNLGVIHVGMGSRTGSMPFYETGPPLVPGAPGDAPKKGASEVHLGRLKDGRRFLATVEPWHGTDVAVYLSESLSPLKFGPRNVIDTTLKEGHALWVADVDGDGDDEVFAGYRGPGSSLLGYDFDGKTWTRTVVDPDIAAQDLRGGDLDGDGTPDVVAIGGRTHNVVWYRPLKD